MFTMLRDLINDMGLNWIDRNCSFSAVVLSFPVFTTEIVSSSLDRFQYQHIEEASSLELFRWDAEVGPSVPTPIPEDDGVIASFTYYSEDKEERVETTPIPVIDLEEYEMVDLEAEPEMTMWEDYLILPNSLVYTLPGFGSVISLIVFPDADQVVSSDLVVSRAVGAILLHLQRDGSLPEGVPFLSSIGDPAIRCLTGDGTWHYVISCPTVRVGPFGKHLECLPLHRLLPLPRLCLRTNGPG
ncbi:hypothetical protein ISN44_As08g034380 [Arabidopsis suecica]|uniref:Uncharacterized protein n=1 Tax=Arabidopsis suecica TaxID=45249 RepID=A0A8T2BJF1_ARASU|nr:hypothetical protein ISN44_As08g034380 [Arabidopsis suecica]